MGEMIVLLSPALLVQKLLVFVAANFIFYNNSYISFARAQPVNLKCDPCIERSIYKVKAIVHGTKSSSFWQRMRAAALQSGKDMGVDLSFHLHERFDLDRMAADIRSSTSGEDPPDALVVTIPSQSIEKAVSEVSNDIPVFGFNSGYDIAGRAGVLGFVAMDEYQGGVLAAKEFLSRSNVTRAVFVNVEKGNSAMDARFAGFKETLQNESFSAVQVDEFNVDLDNDIDVKDLFKGCPYDAVLLGGESQLEVATSLYYANSCSFSKNLLATFDVGSRVYDSIAVGKLSFAISQQQHLQSTLSVLMAALYATTGKKLAPAGFSDLSTYLSGPVVKTLSNLPSDTLQTCEDDGFPVCPNTRIPDGSRESNCACTDRKIIKIGGVVHGFTTDQFWDHVFAAADQAAHDMRVELEMPRFEPVLNDPNREILQAKMANKMISLCQEGIDGLFVSVPGPNVFDAIRECQSLGIPVVSINAGADFSEDLGIFHHISQIEHNAGYGAGKRLVEKGMKRGVFFNHKPGRKDIESRGWGFRDAIEDAAAQGADVTFLGIIDVPFDSELQFEKAVEEAINGWGGDWNNMGILLAASSLVKETLSLKEKHPEVLIGSFDTSNEIFEAIDEGKLLFGIDQEPYLQGYMPVVLLTWFAYTGQKLFNTFIESGPVFIESPPSGDRQFCEATSFDVCPDSVKYDFNHLDNIRPFGLTLFGVIAFTSFGTFLWVAWYRETYIVRSSQSFFLIMIDIGTLILGSTIIPLSIDDGIVDKGGCDIACMAVPWLFFIGFTIAFSALFSKTWRINRLLNSAKHFARVKIMPKDVILPFVVLLVLNVVLLIIWTLVDPMKWERRKKCGSSDIETYGTCAIGNDGAVAILACIAALNFLLILLANYQVYLARKLTIEFEESKYIGLAMMTILQMSIICLPVSFLVNEDPEAKFVVQTSLIFVLCMSILLLIFLPKIIQLWVIKKAKRSGASSRPNTPRYPTGSGLGVIPKQNSSSLIAQNDGSSRFDFISHDQIHELGHLMDEQGVDSESLFRQVGIAVQEVRNRSSTISSRNITHTNNHQHSNVAASVGLTVSFRDDSGPLRENEPENR